MQRVTAPKAANPGMCVLGMGAWAAGREGHSSEGPRTAVLVENKSIEKRENARGDEVWVSAGTFPLLGRNTPGTRDTPRDTPGTRDSPWHTPASRHRNPKGWSSLHWCPTLQYSNTPTLQYFNTPIFQHSFFLAHSPWLQLLSSLLPPQLQHCETSSTYLGSQIPPDNFSCLFS